MAFGDLRSTFLSSGAAASFFMLTVSASAQDKEFDWSWEKDVTAAPAAEVAAPAPEAAAPAAETAPEKPAGSQESEGGFQWSWDEGAKSGQPAAAQPGVEQQAETRGDEAYQKLLKENLDLRRRIAEAMKDGEVARNESTRMASEIKDMEKSLADSVAMIKTLKESQNASMSPEQVNDLEMRVAKAEKDRELLTAEIDSLKKIRDEADGKVSSATANVAQASDLFQKKEQENVALKKRLADIESERRRLAKEKEDLAAEAQKAKSELEEINKKALAAARQGAELKKIVDKLPDIEGQVTNLRSDLASKDEKLGVREQQLEALTVELAQRERRLAKAQKMTELLEQARAEIQQVDNKEKLDMHYNMAVIYAKEGRLDEAEAEYLKALRIDPTDADIHYNLGILYDQDLKKPGEAVIHYRRYLTLRPNAADSDQVKNWIMELQMSK